METAGTYLSPKSGKTICRPVFLALGICGLLHAALGADPLVPALAIVAMAFGIYPMIRFGAWNIGSLLVFLVAFRYVGFPIVGKLAFAQPLDSNLDTPLRAFAVATWGIFSYLLAFLIANQLKTGTPLLRPVTDPRLLRRLSYMAFLIGSVAHLEYSFRVHLPAGAWNISNAFMPMLHLALIASVSATILRSSGSRILDGWTFFILAMELMFAFVQNTRTPIIEAVLAVAVVDVSFRGSITKKQIAITVSAIAMLMVLTPVLLFVRGYREELNWKERIVSTLEVLRDWKEAETGLQEYWYLESLRSGFFLKYYGVPSNYLERLSLVNQTDVLVNGADANGTLGTEVVERAIEYALPRFIVPDKPIDYSEGDWMHYMYMGEFRYGNFLSSPLIAAGYAAFRWSGAFLFPFIIGFSVFLFLKKATGLNIYGNVWAVYFFITINGQFVEGGSWSNLALLFRQLPQDTLILLVLSYVLGTNRLVFRTS